MLFGRISATRYAEERYPSLPPPARGTQGFPWNRFDNPAVSWIAAYTRVFSAATVNDFRASLARLDVQVSPFAQDWLAPDYGILIPRAHDRAAGLPRFQFGGAYGFTALGSSLWAPTRKLGQNWQLKDTLVWNHGAHTTKIGADLRFTRVKNFSAQLGSGEFQHNGRFTGVGLADFLLGWTSQFRQTSFQQVDGRFESYMFFVQHNWRASPKLTVELGLRYELTSPLRDRNDRMSKFLIAPGPGRGTFVLAGERGDSWSDRALVETDANNWAPRAGLAYQLGRRLTFRAGAGLF